MLHTKSVNSACFLAQNDCLTIITLLRGPNIIIWSHVLCQVHHPFKCSSVPTPHESVMFHFGPVVCTQYIKHGPRENLGSSLENNLGNITWGKKPRKHLRKKTSQLPQVGGSQLYRWHIWHSCYSASVKHKKPQYTCSAWSDRCWHEYGRGIC